LSSAAVAIPAIAVSGCALFQQNANGSYGLSAAVLTFISNAVAAVASYIPAAESIAATAASLFGPAYATIVSIGSTAINTVISYLQNLVANPPTLGASGKSKSVYARFGLPLPSSGVVGYTKNGIAVFSA
jgi:hypothetical protein